MADVRCADISVARDEPAWATASVVRSWVLVEQPGAWGPEAVVESRLPPDVSVELERRADHYGIRVLVIRRPDRPRSGPRHCFVAHSGRPSPWIEHRMLGEPEEVLDFDWEAVADGRPPGFGGGWAGPLYLVCTNGRHDPCCARLGRPLVRAMLAERPRRVWECSHIGGDRFAANLVCFPHGLYFGRVGPQEAPGVVALYEEGLLDLEHFRGRAGDPFPVQAAEYFLRRDQGVLGVDEITPLGRRGLGPGLVEVRLAGPGGSEFTVHVRIGTADEPRKITCAGVQQFRPRAYQLAGVFPRGDSGPAVH